MNLCVPALCTLWINDVKRFLLAHHIFPSLRFFLATASASVSTLFPFSASLRVRGEESVDRYNFWNSVPNLPPPILWKSGKPKTTKKWNENDKKVSSRVKKSISPKCRAPLSRRSRCIFEATVVIVIYYGGAKKPKVCEQVPQNDEGTSGGHPQADMQAHTQINMHTKPKKPSDTGLPVWLKHSFFTAQSVEPCLEGLRLNNRCIRKGSVSTTVRVNE